MLFVADIYLKIDLKETTNKKDFTFYILISAVKQVKVAQYYLFTLRLHF